MFAKEYPLSRITQQEIFQIPFFQRTYVWDEGNWADLWEELASEKKGCFLGSVIIKKAPDPLREKSYQKLVDGQQRLTTLTILLRAMNDSLGDGTEVDRDYEKYLYCIKTRMSAKGKHTERDYKIEHSRVDAPFYRDIIDGKYSDISLADDETPENRLVSCYKFFRKKFMKATDEEIGSLSAKLLFDESKILVFIELEEDENEQTIFDSINSLGVKLTTSDIIKNDLFQRVIEANRAKYGEKAVPVAAKLYEETWVKTFEQDQKILATWLKMKGIGHNVRTNIDTFFATFAQIEGFYNPTKSKIADLAPLYAKHIKAMDAEEIEEFIRKVCDHAEIYLDTFVCFDAVTDYSFDDGKTRLLQMLNKMGYTAFDAFILKVLTTCDEKKQIEKFSLLERFVMRNYVVDSVSTRSYNKLANEMVLGTFDFAGILADDCLSDDRVARSLKSINTTRAGLVLFWIELHRHTNPESDLHAGLLKYIFEVEHIMPQAWREHWGVDALTVKGEDGTVLAGEEAEAERAAAIQQIGNMTLLSSKLNKELRNYPFGDKVRGRMLKNRWQDGMAKQTSFSITKDVVQRDPLVWDEDSIRERTESLAQEFNNVWPAEK